MRRKVVFISNEILIKEITGYAGGLGILSGGLISSARDIGYPMVGITLVNKGGYVRHELKNGEVVDYADEYDPEDYFRKIKKKFSIELKDRTIYFQVWEDKLSEDVSIYFIDTDVEENDEWTRKLTYRLYVDESDEQKIMRRFLLSIGALKIVDELKIPVKKFHLNESHCGMLAIELYKRYRSYKKVKEKIVFTTHTPLPHGHEKFSYELVEKYYEIPREIKMLSPDVLNMSKILFELSIFRNGVSWKHRQLLERDFPGVYFDYVTNGVHTKWVEDDMRDLYDKYLPGWFYNPKKFVNAGIIHLNDLKEARLKTKEVLINFINENAYKNREFDMDAITIVARRRITRYKRNDLILKNLGWIDDLSRKYNLQIYITGTTHPYDVEGKGMIKYMNDAMSTLSSARVALHFRNGKKYERIAVAGGDIFLHTPIPPLEACGTSWMRAGMNAVPILASRDGGVVESIIDNFNGWLFGENSFNPDWSDRNEEFYYRLTDVLKLYRENEQEYWNIARNALKTIGPLFNTHRALMEYINRAYEKNQ